MLEMFQTVEQIALSSQCCDLYVLSMNHFVHFPSLNDQRLEVFGEFVTPSMAAVRPVHL